MAESIIPRECIALSIGNTDLKIISSLDGLFHQTIWDTDMHFHLFCECHFLKKGSVILKTDTQLLELKDNTLCIIPANMEHSFKTLYPVSEKASFYVSVSQNKSTENDTFSIYNQIFASNAPYICEGLGQRFEMILQLIQSEASSEFLFTLKLQSLFSLIFIELLECSTISPISSKKQRDVDYEDELKLKIESFIINNFSLNANWMSWHAIYVSVLAMRNVL